MTACAPDAMRDQLIVASATLFSGRRQVIIRHENEDYRLSITAAGKLILTK